MVDVEAEYRRLEQRHQLGGRLEQRVEPGSPVGLVLGFANPGGTRLLVIETTLDGIAVLGGFEETRGIRTRRESRDGPHDWTMGLVLESSDSNFNDVFAALVGDVLEVATRAPAGSALSEIAGRLARWRRFLERITPQGLSLEAQRGLYGELRFLRDHLLGAVGDVRAVSSWLGPTSEVQDFVVAAVGIEVKTTAVRSHQALKIASEHQLDPRGLDELFLYHLSVDARPNLGETLPEIVHGIRVSLVAASARVGFEDLLLEAGYHHSHEPVYDSGYTTRAESIYEVRAGFPRIVEGDLAAGVGDVRYSIATESCIPFSVTFESVLESLAMAGGR